MSFLMTLRRLFITRKCVLCKEPISYDADVPFCKDCIKHWKAFLEIKCTKCGFKHTECTCLPEQIKKFCKHGAVWCVFYDSESQLFANNLVFKLKREYNRDMIELCASLMAKNLKALCARYGIDYKDYVVTYSSRREVGKIRYGFDHTRKIAIALSRILGIKVENCFINKGKKEQKSLSKNQRRENAKASYYLKKNAQIADKKFFLVDDIITTGATMSACIELLYSQGANDVIPVAYAKSNK